MPIYNDYKELTPAIDWFFVKVDDPKDIARVAVWAMNSTGHVVGLLAVGRVQTSTDRLYPRLQHSELNGLYKHWSELTEEQRKLVGPR